MMSTVLIQKLTRKQTRGNKREIASKPDTEKC